MYRRRRRRSRDIAFGLDSFLDVITNVIGIIIRMILVVWIGARAYYTLQYKPIVQPGSTPAAQKQPGGCDLEKDIAAQRRKLQQAETNALTEKSRLSALESQTTTLNSKWLKLVAARKNVQKEVAAMNLIVGAKDAPQHITPTLLAKMTRQNETLKKEIADLQKAPRAKKAIHYRAPVSRPVEAEELFFECRAGRASFVDIAALVREARAKFGNAGNILKQQWSVERTTHSVGAFRLRFVIERRKGALDNVFGGIPDQFSNFSYGLREWQVEPLAGERGETLAQALQAQSTFRRIVDHADPRHTVVTLWVYPDSFAIYRGLRDYLHQRDVEVAGRPLPMGHAIRASRHGTRSRGQ